MSAYGEFILQLNTGFSEAQLQLILRAGSQVIPALRMSCFKQWSAVVRLMFQKRCCRSTHWQWSVL